MATPIPTDWEVPPIFRDRMGERAGKQRAMIAEGHLMLVLHELPDPDRPGTRAPRLFWRRPDGVWRASHVRAAADAGPLRAHLDTFAKSAEAIEERVEEAADAEDYFEVLREVAPLLRTTRNMHKALQVAREALGNDRTLIALRDQAADLERATELIHVYAKEGLDFTVARQAEEQGRASAYIGEAGHRLNLLIALFLPITALGSLLGMSLVHGFERWNAPYTFWAVAFVAFLLGFAVRATLPKPPVARASRRRTVAPQPSRGARRERV